MECAALSGMSATSRCSNGKPDPAGPLSQALDAAMLQARHVACVLPANPTSRFFSVESQNGAPARRSPPPPPPGVSFAWLPGCPSPTGAIIPWPEREGARPVGVGEDGNQPPRLQRRVIFFRRRLAEPVGRRETLPLSWGAMWAALSLQRGPSLAHLGDGQRPSLVRFSYVLDFSGRVQRCPLDVSVADMTSTHGLWAVTATYLRKSSTLSAVPSSHRSANTGIQQPPRTLAGWAWPPAAPSGLPDAARHAPIGVSSMGIQLGGAPAGPAPSATSAPAGCRESRQPRPLAAVQRPLGQLSGL